VQAQLNIGTISSSLGGAGASSLDALESPLLNPATLPHFEDFIWGFYYSQRMGAESSNERASSFIFSDSTSANYFPAAFAYVKEDITSLEGATITSKNYVVSFGGFVLPTLSLGMNLHRKNSLIDEATRFSQNNYGLGMLWAPTSSIGMSVVGHSLARPSSLVPDNLKLKSKVSLGGYFIYLDSFHFRADVDQTIVENPKNKKTFKLGVESRLWRFIALRWGFQWDKLIEKNMFTAGVGFNGPNLNVDYAFQNEIERGGGTRHLIDLRLPF